METSVQFLGGLLLLIDWLLRPLFCLLNAGRSPRLPPVGADKDILYSSARTLASKIRDGVVSSEQVVRAFIDRVRAVEPLLCAVVQERFASALDEARRADAEAHEWRARGAVDELARVKPYLGVPLTIKESCSLAGQSSSVGSMTRIGMIANNDGSAVARMKQAGAIPLLVSNTPELCLGWESANLLRKATCNPYCLKNVPGGSSGGEAALLGSAASVIGVGSDIAGSIRIPAMFTGVYGHKPTPGIIPIEGHIPTVNDENFSKFLTVGPMTRYAEDLTGMLKVMAGSNADQLRLDEPVELNKLKMRYMYDAGNSLLLMLTEQEIKDRLRAAVTYLNEDCGVQLIEGGFKELEESLEMSVSVFFAMKDLPNLLQDPSDPKVKRNLLIEVLKTCLGSGTISLQALLYDWMKTSKLYIPLNKQEIYKDHAAKFRKIIGESLGDNGVFIYPTFPSTAIYHRQVFTKAAGVMYTMIFNVLGLPATNVPLGLDRNGMPIGIQVIAAPNQDRLCLAVAKQLEKQFGGWTPPS